MGDAGEIWEGYREAQQARRRIRLPIRQQEILALRGKGYDVVEMNDGYCFRIDGKLDLYPIHRRWHFLPRNVRGDYKNALACCVKLLKHT